MISASKIENVVRHIANKNSVKVSNVEICVEPGKNDDDVINWVTVNITTDNEISEKKEKRIQIGIDRYFYRPGVVSKHFIVAMVEFFTK